MVRKIRLISGIFIVVWLGGIALWAAIRGAQLDDAPSRPPSYSSEAHPSDR